MAPKKKDKGDKGRGKKAEPEAPVVELTPAEVRVLEAEAARRKEDLEQLKTSFRDPSATPSKQEVYTRTRGRRGSDTQAAISLRGDVKKLDLSLAQEVVEESFAAEANSTTNIDESAVSNSIQAGADGDAEAARDAEHGEGVPEPDRAQQWHARKTRGDSARGSRPRDAKATDPDQLIETWRQEFNLPNPDTPPPEPIEAFVEEDNEEEDAASVRPESVISFSEFDDPPPATAAATTSETHIATRGPASRSGARDTAKTAKGKAGAAVPNGAVAAQARSERLEIAKAKRYRIQCERDLAAKEAAARVSEEELRAAQDRHRQLVVEHAEAQDAVAEAHDLRPADLKVLEDKVDMAAALIRAQQDVIVAQERNNDQRVRELVDAEARVRENTLVAAKISDVEAAILAEQERLAVQRHKQAVRAQKKAEAAKEAQRIAAEERERVQGERTRDAIAKAQTGQLAARMRLKAAQREIKKLEDESAAQQAALLERRKQAVLDLRKHTDEALNKLKGANQRRRKRLEAQRQAEEEEKQHILAAGGNPYEVFRRRAENARLEREIERRAQALRETERKSIAAVYREDEEFQKREKQRLKHKKAVEQHSSEMGNTAPRLRAQQYMSDIASGPTGILDPTSRQRELLPSKFTNAKTWKFGMGGADPQLLERIKKKYPNAMFDEKTLRRLMGPAKAAPVKPKEEEIILASSIKAKKKAAEATSDGESSEEEVFALDTDQGLWDNDRAGDVSIPAVATDPALVEAKAEPKLSKMEERMLENARTRQRENLTKKQVVLGREFKGQAFISKPDKVVFKDFQVGETYSQTIVLTNVSFSINSFKLQALPDDICDFFEFQYTPPGQMSAGLTCKMTITFTPKRHADISSHIRLISMTGPIRIPLECTTRKTVIAAVPSELDFGPVVLGEKVTKTFKIVNDGANPSAFTVSYPRVLDPDVSMISLVPSYTESAAEDVISDAEFEFEDPDYQNLLGELREEFAGPALGLDSPTESMRTASTTASSSLGSDDSTDLSSFNTDFDEKFDFDHLHTTYRSSRAGLSIREVRSESTALSSFRTTYRNLFPDENKSETSKALKPQPIFQGTTEGVSQPYSTTLIHVTFTPFKVEDYSAQITVNFESKEAKNVELTVRGEGVDVPIYLEREVLDFNVCCNDVMYRDSLVIHNRSKTALKCTVEVVSDLHGYLEVLPKVGFVQGHSSFNITVKFRPRNGLLRQARRYCNPQTGVLEVPMRVVVPDQVLPVYFLFRVQMTSATIRLNPNKIDFGRVAVGESVRVPFKIKNTSALPQRVGFPHKPSYLSISPDDGFCELLPYETQYKHLVFTPQIAMDYDFTTTLKTLTNREFSIKCSAVAFAPWITFEPKTVNFAAASLGDSRSTFIRITNPTRNPLIFEFVPPEHSNISVSPQLGELGPKETRRLYLEFKPTRASVTALKALGKKGGDASVEPEVVVEEEADSAPPSPEPEVVDKKKGKKGKADAKGKDKNKDKSKGKGNAKGKGKKGEPEPDSEDEEEKAAAAAAAEAARAKALAEEDADRATWCFSKEWCIPCFVTTEPDGEKRTDKDVSVTRLGIRTVAIKPQVLVETLGHQVIEAIKFGRVSLGKPATEIVILRNHSDRTVTYKLEALDPNGVFTVVNALRPIPPKSSFKLQVKFAPTTETNYYDHLLLSTNDANNLNIRVSGNGVSPALVAKPAGPGLDMGDAGVNGFIERQITLSNGSPFAVKYAVSITDFSHHNHSRLVPFDCSPIEAVIDTGSEKQLTVRFAPDHEYLDYRARMIIRVADQSQTIEFDLSGRCWDRGVFIRGGSTIKPPLANPFLVPRAPVVEEKGAPKTQAVAAPVQEVELVFNDPHLLPDSEPLEGSFDVGNPKGGNDKKANAEVTVESLPADAIAAGFSIETPKLSVESGATKPVVFKFKPSAEFQLARRGQWVDFVAKCVLKGGTPPPPTGDGYRVNVTLKGYCPDAPGLAAAVAKAREAGTAGGSAPKGKKK